MVDSLRDGQVRQIYNTNTYNRYKVTIPDGWVEANQNKLSKLSDEWVWGDNYTRISPDLPELPHNIKAQFGLDAPPPPHQGQVRYRDDRDDGDQELPPPNRARTGGKSKKHPTARRRRSSKARKSRKVSKSRATRRR